MFATRYSRRPRSRARLELEKWELKLAGVVSQDFKEPAEGAWHRKLLSGYYPSTPTFAPWDRAQGQCHLPDTPLLMAVRSEQDALLCRAVASLLSASHHGTVCGCNEGWRNSMCG